MATEKKTETSFTPGPWFYERAHGYSGFFIARRTPASGSGMTGIASTYGHTDDRETEANARLVAAAPSLYDAALVTLGILRDGDPRDAVIFLEQALALAGWKG